jgi:hypothetical protein
MKKLLLCLVLTGWLVFQSSSAVAAYIYGIEAGDMIKFTHSTGPNGGGEFTWVAADNGYTWQSFCVEKNEYISLNHSYEVRGISGYAMAGGVSGQDANIGGIWADSLSNETAWLFWNFSMGTLGKGSKYAYNSSNAQEGYLQNIIWYLEDEIAVSSFNKKTTEYYEAWHTDYLASGWTNQGQVQVVNLGYFDAKGNWKGIQDQLIIGRHVPEPGTLFLLGFGLIGITGISRKKHRN